MTTEDEFRAAVTVVSGLAQDPGNDTKLRLYAFYKQATGGDVAGDRPGSANVVGRAKYDAWASMQGMSHEDAKAEYVDLAAGLSRA